MFIFSSSIFVGVVVMAVILLLFVVCAEILSGSSEDGMWQKARLHGREIWVQPLDTKNPKAEGWYKTNLVEINPHLFDGVMHINVRENDITLLTETSNNVPFEDSRRWR
jgi:hypothetical protein